MKTCRFCQSTDLKIWTGNYYRCNDCLYICTVPVPTPAEINNHYAHYHEKNHQASEAKNKARAVSYIQEVDWIKSQVTGHLEGPVFDYGASGGYFLDALVEYGGIQKAHAFGDDLSIGAVDTLTEKGYHLSVDKVEGGTMNLVVLRGVLEHLVDFRGLLKQLTDLVAEDGYFFITATPDSSSTVANLYRNEWVQHHYPSHFQHFSAALIDELFAELNFVLADHVDLYRHSVYRSAQDDENWLSTVQKRDPQKRHAYWGSMMTRLYKRP
jgi:SAM-dependent methyltransferase